MPCNGETNSKTTPTACSPCYLKHRGQKHAKIKGLPLLLALFSVCLIQGQNLQWQVWKSNKISQLEFHLPFVSKISITTSKENFIRVHYRSEGEYRNDYLLQKKWEGNQLIVEEIPTPQRPFYNDKLSAHKVVATQIDLILPETVSLQLFVKEALLFWEGNHDAIHIELTRGKAVIKAKNLSGKIKTSKADVDVYGLNGKVKIECGSGQCNNFHTHKKDKSLEINSRLGDISLYPS